MIRKTIIVALTLAAIFTGALGWMGFRWGAYFDCSITSRFCCYVHSAEGLVRLYFFSADQRIYLRPSPSYTHLSVRRAVDDEVCCWLRHATPQQISPYALYWRRQLRAAPRGRSPVLMTGVRTWVGLPVALFLVYPVLAVLWERVGKLLKPRRGHCRTCGYNLTGNTSGACPECGATLAEPG